MRKVIYGLILLGLVGVGVGIGALLANISRQQTEARQYPLKLVEIGPDEIDASVWGQNFPLHYERFMMTENNYGETPYGGSEPYSKLERYPAMVRLWAGYAFSKDHNEERGHFYSQIDQRETERVQLVSQPGACINCHSGEAPLLIAEMGWEEFNRTPYNDLVDQLHTASTCADCHDPETMALRLTRPGLINALEADGINWTESSRQEMRTYVCAQCHVEYYFAGDDKVLTFPWAEGTNIDEIDQYYQNVGFTDWTHAETGGRMIKVQHPEYELYTSGLHYSAGVACADCHMPYIREGGIKISDHWVRSPLTNVGAACQTCHNVPEAELETRILTIQNRTAELLRITEETLIEAIDVIVAAREAGATDEDLAEAWEFHRRAQLRWDFISSENSTGFHSPQEAARVLAMSIDFAHRAKDSANAVLVRLTSPEAVTVAP
ncbi:MAG: ammonia-forming cytochrome c nitrite reductase subunit c552 [Anaerolineae bacterium]|jgi:nitrite reductase (cytochrome c-552)|nr:ammonia-forming cytochrome c nitrite reductase subunit c552 [Anaerolineae bacterium]